MLVIQNNACYNDARYARYNDVNLIATDGQFTSSILVNGCTLSCQATKLAAVLRVGYHKY